MGADNPVIVCEHDEASETGVFRIVQIELRKKMSVIHGHLTPNVALALENLYLREHLFFVLFNSLFDYRSEDINIAFSASKSDF